MKKFLALSPSNVVFIMLINVKMHFNIYEQDKFRAQLSYAWKKFYNLKATQARWIICGTRQSVWELSHWIDLRH